MELPSDPANLLYGVYGRSGYKLDEEEKIIEEKMYIHALSDEEDNTLPNNTAFDMVDYYY